jgi:glucose/arabinose dehydrogenase
MHTWRTLPLVAVVLLAGCSTASDDVGLSPATPSPSASSTPPLQTPTPSPTLQPSPEATADPMPEITGPGDVAVPRVTGTVATGLRSPWGLAFLPDGRALVSERDTARVVVVSDDGVTPAGVVPGVFFGGEGGLLGLAVSPEFRDDRQVYAYATMSQGNTVLRMTLRGGRLSTPRVILDGIPASSIHNGGRLAFGPDGMLYVTTGDASNTALSPQQDSLGGKILRITPDGAIPPDNPDPDSPVYSSGHRNVQGIAWDAEGNLWASEFGAQTWDELNLIRPGADYGWPTHEGTGGEGSGFVDPVQQWPTDQASPSGIAVADGTVFMASLRGQRLWAVPVGAGKAGDEQAFFSTELGRLRTVAEAPDGSLWLITNNTDGRGSPRPGDDRILRLSLR